jgi:hypothetical protein
VTRQRKPTGDGASRNAGIRALEEARYGRDALLNLRDSLPTESDAVARAESWLRERQVRGIAEVLIITGRGKSSPGGTGIVREGVRRLLNSLRRRGVIAAYGENGPGSFLVALAPMKKLFESPARRRDRKSGHAPPPGVTIEGLPSGLLDDLRLLAQQSLLSLGVDPSGDFLEGEMRRQYSVLSASLPTSHDRESLLAAAVRRAISEYENE